MAPVGILGFTSAGSRALTTPSTRITHSARTVSIAAKAGLSPSASTWVTP